MKPSRSFGSITSSELPNPSSTRMQSFSGTTPRACSYGLHVIRRKRELRLRILRMHQERRPSSDIRLQQRMPSSAASQLFTTM